MPQHKLGFWASWRIKRRLVASSRPAVSPMFIFSPARAMVVFVLLALAMTSGVSAYAYYSPDVTVVSPLYPIKKKLESLEMKIARTPEKKTAQLVKQAERRLAEAESLSQDNQDSRGALVDQTLDEANFNNLQAEELAKNSKPDKKIESDIEQSQGKQLVALRRVVEKIKTDRPLPALNRVIATFEARIATTSLPQYATTSPDKGSDPIMSRSSTTRPRSDKRIRGQVDREERLRAIRELKDRIRSINDRSTSTPARNQERRMIEVPEPEIRGVKQRNEINKLNNNR